MVLAAAWQFGINDPSFIAWVICGAYLLAAASSWRARTSDRYAPGAGAHALWGLLCPVLLGLGINKQLDLHHLLLQGARDALSNRGTLMAAGGALAILAVPATVAVFMGSRLLRQADYRVRWAYAVVVGLLGLQVLRFLPGPQADMLVYHVFTEEEGWLHIHVIELLELASLVAIVILARSALSPADACRGQSR